MIADTLPKKKNAGALLRAVILLAEYGREVLEEQEKAKKEKEKVQTEYAH